MEFDIFLKNNHTDSDRVNAVLKDFDMKPEHACERFVGNIDIDGKDWQIGLIVGSSGTGKSTIARTLFPESYTKEYLYSGGAVLDDMPQCATIQEIELAFTSVGFASPPSWLKPYSALSTGEKMRVDLARAILSNNSLVVFDEFTSVVDRTIAKTTSLAVQKAIRKRADKRFIAVSCHKDIQDWLMPDWVYDTDQKAFFGLGGDMKSPLCDSIFTGLKTGIKNRCGTYLGSITI